MALSTVGAREQLWPAYMVHIIRRPIRIAAADFIGVVMGPHLGARCARGGIGSLASAGRFSAWMEWKGRTDGSVGGRPDIFPLYYALGCAGLFHNDYAINGHL
jgi:hypothetical protein